MKRCPLSVFGDQCNKDRGHDGPHTVFCGCGKLMGPAAGDTSHVCAKMCFATNVYGSTGKKHLICVAPVGHVGAHGWASIASPGKTEANPSQQCTVWSRDIPFRCVLQLNHNGEHYYSNAEADCSGNCSCGKPMGPAPGAEGAVSHVCAKSSATESTKYVLLAESNTRGYSKVVDVEEIDDALAKMSHLTEAHRPKLYKLVEVDYEVVTKVVIKDSK